VRVMLSGSRKFGADALHLLLGLGHEVAAVATPDAADRLAMLASDLGIPCRAWGDWENLPPGLDLIVCAHSWDIVPASALAAARLGGIGYHPSMLPAHKGRRAVGAALAAGDRVTGGTVYGLTDSVDGGPILSRAEVEIEPGEDAATLWRRALHPLGLRLLASVLMRDEDPADWDAAPEILERTA